MNDKNFQQIYEAAIMKNNSLLCVGLEPEYEKLPMAIKEKELPLFEFNKAIIAETGNHVCAFKFNAAFYEAEGENGIAQLKKTCEYAKNAFPDIPLILDAKIGDIASTNQAYIRYAYDYLGVDAITLHPYFGKESLAPFLNITNKGNFILCRTSNPGAGEIQDLVVETTPLYQTIAAKVAGEWNQNGNCMLIVGGQTPEEITQIRQIVGQEMILLLPGKGTKAIDLEKIVKAGSNIKHTGIIVNVSKEIMYASQDSNFFIKAREAAIKLKEEINTYRSSQSTLKEPTEQTEEPPIMQPKISPLVSMQPEKPKEPESQPTDFTE
jgi:orotidine-5'-phosphate decarboxylase